MKVFLILLTLTLSCFGGYTTTVEVSYLKPEGWTGKFKREVTFMKAVELRNKGVQVGGEDRTPYATIWFSEENVAIIKLFKDVTPLGDRFDSKDFHKLLRVRTAVEGVSVNGDENPPQRWRFWKSH